MQDTFQRVSSLKKIRRYQNQINFESRKNTHFAKYQFSKYRKKKLSRTRNEWINNWTPYPKFQTLHCLIGTVVMSINFLYNILPVLYMNPTKSVKIWKHVNFPIILIIQVSVQQLFKKHKFKVFDYLFLSFNRCNMQQLQCQYD